MALVNKETERQREEYKLKHGTYPISTDKIETREEAIERTQREVNSYIRKLSHIDCYNQGAIDEK